MDANSLHVGVARSRGLFDSVRRYVGRIKARFRWCGGNPTMAIRLGGDRMSEVKTRQTFEEWIKSKGYDDGRSNAAREQGWNAALASVISTGKRFEVGDSCRIRVSRDTEIEAIIGAMPIQQLHKADDFVSQPGIVRPAINTVNLTVEEKLVAVTDAMVSKDSYQERHVYRELSRVLAKGKSLDDLCREYSVPLTKEV